MANTRKRVAKGRPRIPIDISNAAQKSSEPSLLMTRIKELDHEFARQSKQLAKTVKALKNRFTDKL